VLDGLKHGYPLHAAPDILLAGLLAVGWNLCVRGRFFLLFAAVMLASLASDIVDLGPGILRSVAGISTPMWTSARFSHSTGPTDPGQCIRC
jgi:hypothetical protein